MGHCRKKSFIKILNCLKILSGVEDLEDVQRLRER